MTEPRTSESRKRRSPRMAGLSKKCLGGHHDCSTGADTIHGLDHDAWLALDDFAHGLFFSGFTERAIAEALRCGHIAESDLRLVEGVMRRAGRYLERARASLSAARPSTNGRAGRKRAPHSDRTATRRAVHR